MLRPGTASLRDVAVPKQGWRAAGRRRLPHQYPCRTDDLAKQPQTAYVGMTWALSSQCAFSLGALVVVYCELLGGSIRVWRFL